MRGEQPTRRPTDAASREPDAGHAPPADLLNLPWIDAHNHAHTLSWADRERFALTGCAGMVTVASGYQWTPYRPVEPDDVRYRWDEAFARRGDVERAHGFDVGLAVGVHTGVRVDDVGTLLDALPGYLGADGVVAVGETGVTPSQHVEAWDVAGQRAAVRRQMALAAEFDLPVLLHTPSTDSDGSRRRNRGRGAAYELDPGLRQAPVIDGPDAALEAVEIDVEVARDVGLSEDRVVASHAGPHTLGYLMEETDCYASLTVGYPWLHGITAADAAEAIDAYGPERLMLDTDAANVLRCDVAAIKRAILELHRLGIEPGDIRRVVYENPRSVYGVEE